MEPNNRLDLLKRRTVGQRLLPELKAKLASALGLSPETLHLLSLEESDEIRARASHAFPPRDRLHHRSGEYPFVSKRVMTTTTCKLFLPETEADVFLVLPEADRVGVLQLPTATVNAQWTHLLRVGADGFILVDTTYSNKAVLQIDTDEGFGREVFDIAAWGVEWSNALRGFSP